nr:MAG TPA: hypothetical protein [Caudoviricetes sp.]
MNSIISPWVFYLIGMADVIQFLALFASIGFVVISGFLWFDWLHDLARYGEKDEDVLSERKTVVKVSIVTIVSLAVLVLTPSSSTCYKMLAADMFTQDNINNATEYVTDVIDYAVDRVKELSPTTENERS